MARRAPRTARLLSTCLLLGALLAGCGKDEDERGWLVVSGAFSACGKGPAGCGILPAWDATVEVISLPDGEKRVLTLERDGTVAVRLPEGTYRLRMGYPEMGIEPEPFGTTFEMRDGITRDVPHLFEQRLGPRGPRG